MKKASVKRKFESFGFSSSNPQDHRNVRELVLHIQNQVQKGNDFTLKFHSWMKISMLKQKIHKFTKLDQGDFRITFKNQELSLNNQDLEDYGIKNHVTLKLAARNQAQQLYFINSLYDILEESKHTQEKFSNAKWAIEGAFTKGITPKLTDFGTQGTYILENINHKPVAIFKPYDEEAFAPNNPRGMRGKMNSPGLRQGVLSGEGVDREVAAYLIDQSAGHYHNVPITNYVQICHPAFHEAEEYKQFQYEKIPVKEGSLQLYVQHDDNVGNYGSRLYPSKEARKIAILDIRILNCDRNEENILVRKTKLPQQNSQSRQTYDFFLIPIDHGYSFPDSFKICRDEVVWYHWDQMTQPFSIEERQYLDNIDPVKDIKMLKNKIQLREICLRNARISTTLLKMGAEYNLTIHDIAELLYREDTDVISPLEKAVSNAEYNYENGIRIPKPLKFQEKMFKNNLIQKSLEFENRKTNNTEKSNESCFFQLVIIEEDDKLKTSLHEKDKIFENGNGNGKEDNEKKQTPKKLTRVISQQNLKKKSRKLINVLEKEWDEEFYAHINYFLQEMIKSKAEMQETLSPKRHRPRYISENIQ